MDNLNTINCEECKHTLVPDDTEKCKFCKKNVCKECILRKYPDWTLTGCKWKPNWIWNQNVILYHCIYSYSFDDVEYTCDKWAHFSNICDDHVGNVEFTIQNVLNMLPFVLTDLITEYFFLNFDHCRNCKKNERLLIDQALIDYARERISD